MKIPFRIAGNWKLNKNIKEAAEFTKGLVSAIDVKQQPNVTVYPPALVAQTVAENLKGSKITWGLQNCYSQLEGAFTGENSAGTLKEMGGSSCLIGHSERRIYFAETDLQLAVKILCLQKVGLEAVLCVGETIEQRRASLVRPIIESQLELGLCHADFSKPIAIAYEPVWAIGTGEVARPDQVFEAHSVVRSWLMRKLSESGEKIPIWYGGSVKPDNAGELARVENVNGFLIGGASLKIADFSAIVKESL